MDSTFSQYSRGFYYFSVLTLIRPFSGSRQDNFSIPARILHFPGTRLDSTNLRYSHIFDRFQVLAGKVFRYSHGFYLFAVLARILPFFGTHTDSTILRYSPTKFFVTRTDFLGSRPNFTIFLYTHRFYHFSLLVRTVFRYSLEFYLYPVVARIQQFLGTHTGSTIFLNWSGQFFGTRTDSSFRRKSPGFNNFSVLTLILPFCRTGFGQFFGTRTDSKFYR